MGQLTHDWDPSFALEETCCTLVEEEMSFGYSLPYLSSFWKQQQQETLMSVIQVCTLPSTCVCFIAGVMLLTG